MVRIRPGDRSSGKADFNISLIAKQNDGVYAAEAHRDYIEKELDYIEPENRAGYLDSHLKRLETLEQNGIVTLLDDGRYEVPSDIIVRGEEVTKQINAREKKRFFPRVDTLCNKPLADLVNAQKKTWLDKELYKQGLGKPSISAYDADTLQALEQRKEWLVARDLAFVQSNGQFALREKVLQRLDLMEVVNAGNKLAAKLDTQFIERKVTLGERYGYLGYLTLESGHWCVVKNASGDVQMGKVENVPELSERVDVEFEDNGQGGKILKQAQRQQEYLKAHEIDRDDELER